MPRTKVACPAYIQMALSWRSLISPPVLSMCELVYSVAKSVRFVQQRTDSRDGVVEDALLIPGTPPIFIWHLFSILRAYQSSLGGPSLARARHMEYRSTLISNQVPARRLRGVTIVDAAYGCDMDFA